MFGFGPPPRLTDEQRKYYAWRNTTPLGVPGYAVGHDGIAICQSDHGKLSEWGWECDHIVSLADGGLDVPSNVRAIHWRTNRSRGAKTSNARQAGLSGLSSICEAALPADKARLGLIGPSSLAVEGSKLGGLFALGEEVKIPRVSSSGALRYGQQSNPMTAAAELRGTLASLSRPLPADLLLLVLSKR